MARRTGHPVRDVDEIDRVADGWAYRADVEVDDGFQGHRVQIRDDGTVIGCARLDEAPHPRPASTTT